MQWQSMYPKQRLNCNKWQHLKAKHYMVTVRHPIYCNSREEKCSTWPEKDINIARHCVDGYCISAATAKSVTHMSFRWYVYVSTFRVQSTGGKYATWPATWATGSLKFSPRGCKVLSEPSEPSATHRCFWRILGLLLMRAAGFIIYRMCALAVTHSILTCS
jgi:hypothetical protein